MAYIGKSPTGTGVRQRYYFTATGGETSLSGADDNGLTLAFSDGNYVDVSLNGIALVAGTDYNTSTANTIGGLSALSASDIVEVVVYDIFTVADTVSAANGGTFSGNVTVNGTMTATSFSGDGSGLTGVSAGKVLQFASDQSAIGSGTASIPQDNTAPTITEGTEIFSLAFTPTASNSNLLIQMDCQMSAANNSVYIVWALFEDSTCIGAWSNNSPASNNGCIINFNVVRAASSTSARTYSVRAGRSSGTAGTYYYGYVTGNSYGQLNQNYMSILEIEA